MIHLVIAVVIMIQIVRVIHLARNLSRIVYNVVAVGMRSDAIFPAIIVVLLTWRVLRTNHDVVALLMGMAATKRAIIVVRLTTPT